MTTRLVRTEADRKLLLRYIAAQKLPFTVDVVKGRKRSLEQNKLQQMWISEAAEQLGDRTHEELRGYCKLHHGVPILRNENAAFKEVYDHLIRPMSYEDKLRAMMVPIDVAVTRIMTTDQKTRYLDAIANDFLQQGIVLTDPERRRAA